MSLAPKWPRSRLCAFCGGSFLVVAEHPTQRWCSLSHAMQGQRLLPWVACPVCAVRFPLRKARQRFCSVDCGRLSGARRRAA